MNPDGSDPRPLEPTRADGGAVGLGLALGVVIGAAADAARRRSNAED